MRNPRKRTPKQKFDFLRRLMADKTLSFAAKTVAVSLLTIFHNAKTGRCNPSLPAIAEAAGCSRRTAFSAIAELKDAGWVAVKSTRGGGSNCTNRYSFDFEGVQTSAPPKDPSGVQDSSVGVQGSSVGVQTSAHEPLRTTRASGARGEGEETRQRAPDGALEREETDEIIQTKLEWQFEALCEMWRKPQGINRPKSLKAFETVCIKHDGDNVLANARQWISATTNPQYLPKLERWLEDGAWLNDPPKRRGNGHDRESAVDVAIRLTLEAEALERNGR